MTDELCSHLSQASVVDLSKKMDEVGFSNVHLSLNSRLIMPPGHESRQRYDRKLAGSDQQIADRRRRR